MRTMLKWTVPVEKGNDSIRDGSLGAMMQQLSDELEPEAAYFYAEDGKRAGMMVFEMEDPSRIAQIAERLFLSLNAAVEFRPVMNRDDLRCALDKAST